MKGMMIMKFKKFVFLPISLMALIMPIKPIETTPKENIKDEVQVVARYANTDLDIADCFSKHNLPSEFGNTIGTYFKYGDKYYQNYGAGYLELTPTQKSYVIKNYAGRNIDSKGKLTKVKLDLLLKGVADDFCTSGGDNFAKNLEDGAAVKPIIIEKMKAIYTEYYNKGIILGTRNSYVKCWDGYIVQDFAYGDSTFAFGGDRYAMSFIFYNYRIVDNNEKAGECFVLSSEQASYWDSNKNELGYPTSNLITDSVTLPGSTEKETVTFQTFEGGILYNDTLTGALNYRGGFRYNASTKSFIAEATPYVDGRYGSFVQEFANGDETTIVKVYKKGSVICNLVNGEYVYTYRPARIYKNLTEYDWYDINEFINDVGNTFETDYENQSEISRKLKQKYRDLYKSGYFVGFKESSFHGNWNGVDAQQFILGDSIASPWEGTRTNVAALVYNKEANKIILLADNPLYLWNKGGNFNIYGAPLEDAFKVGDDVFQKFQAGLLVVLKNNVDTAFLYKGTYEEYVAGKEAYERPTFGKETTIEVTVPTNPRIYIVAIAVPLVVVAGGLSIIIVKMNKKKKNMMKASNDL